MTAPFLQVYKTIKATLDAGVTAGAFGVNPPLIREHRFRATTAEEYTPNGCIAVEFAGDDEGELLTYGELLKTLSFNLVLDYPTPLEGDDPTGMEKFSGHLVTALTLLVADGSLMRVLVENPVQATSLEPDPNNASDSARLVQGANVVYRVRADQPSTLLTSGVD